MKKRIISKLLITTFAVSLAFPLHTFAQYTKQNDTQIEVGQSNRTETLTELLSDMFSEPSAATRSSVDISTSTTDFIVLDRNGENITNKFYADNHSAFSANNFNQVLDYIDNNVSEIQKIEETRTPVAQNSTVVDISHVFYRTCNDTDPDYNISGLEVTYKLVGSYTYNETYDIITSATKPTLEYFRTIDWSSQLQCQLNSRHMFYKIDPDGKRVVFSVTFDMDVYVFGPYWGLANVLVDFGTWTSSVTYVANDTPSNAPPRI